MFVLGHAWFLCTSPLPANIPNSSSALSALFVSTVVAAAVTPWSSQLMCPLYSSLSALEKRIPDLYMLLSLLSWSLICTFVF